MSPLEALWAALRALRANPTRSVLTMLGVIIGVAAVIIVVAVGSGARELVVERITSLGSNLLVIEPGAVTSGGAKIVDSDTRLTEDDAAAINNEVPAVQVAVPMVKSGVRTTHGARNWPTLLYGVGEGFLEARDWTVAAGRPLDESDFVGGSQTALLGATLATHLFGAEDPLGAVIRIQGSPFTVVGVLSPKGQTTSGKDQDDAVVMAIRTAKRRVLGINPARERAVGTIFVKIVEDGDIDAVQADVTELLRARHHLAQGRENDFSISNLAEVLRIKGASTRAFTNLVASIALVSLLVGGIGIMNIMLVSVLERTREIGIKMAVGARQRDIMSEFLIEAGALALTGGLIGLMLGVAGAIIAAAAAGWPAIISPTAVVIALGSSLTVGVLFGFYPARRAAALDPVVALRRE